MPYFSNKQANEQQRNLYVQKAGKYDAEYSGQMKRKQLQAEIEQLEKRTSDLRSEVNTGNKILIILGIFLILLSLYSWVICDEFYAFGMLAGIASAAGGGISLSTKGKETQNRLLIAKKELTRKRAELAELNKKRN